ncbi:alpha/beta hydrolase [Nocardioides pocheonensis]|uniref:Alpha/beta fold hydrolase n=1 Tax=Nocardioides pocheonensis TaxID=661485 RepID=A0A3N0GIZ7_9ACTN|nr:alpha/beta fold hydrolase [Nocardioides pocheonensis]RNM12176.1 hypothetical protein EFL26_20445 [Nocardioides pocheonensis]
MTIGAPHEQPITLRAMGSLFYGGRVVQNEAGETCHCDHGYAQYFVPMEACEFPLIMWHGMGQSGKTWESTPDGREGFWQIFTRQGWPVFIVDQPRRGRGGRVSSFPSSQEELPPLPSQDSEATFWGTQRLGSWHPPGSPDFFAGIAFPRDPRSVRQFMAQQTPNTGPEPLNAQHREFMAEGMVDLLDTAGPSILMTHSFSGQYGWVTGMKRSESVKAIVSIEPGQYAFPDDDVPPPVSTANEFLLPFLEPQLVPGERFQELTKIPILILMGDNIADEPDPNADFGIELWRLERERGRQFVDAINKRGGDATYLELPDVGVKGNTHFPMSDLNNAEVAGVVSDFLRSRGLDQRTAPYQEPSLA